MQVGRMLEEQVNGDRKNERYKEFTYYKDVIPDAGEEICKRMCGSYNKHVQQVKGIRTFAEEVH